MASSEGQLDNLGQISLKILEQVKEAVAIISPSLSVLWVNREFCRLTGYQPDQVVDQPLTIFRSGMHSEAEYQSIFRAVTEEGRWHGEIWRRKKSGEAFPAWLTISAIYDEAGEVVCFVDLFVDIGRIRVERERLAFMVQHDPLTGLPNRRLLSDRLSRALKRGRRNQEVFHLLFIDLDYFKFINDQHGHAFGDQVLIQVADTLKNCIREVDTVARVGGDEFVVLLEDSADPQQLEETLARIREAMGKVLAGMGLGSPVGVSMGSASYPLDGETPEALYATADTRMYRSKSSGKVTRKKSD